MTSASINVTRSIPLSDLVQRAKNGTPEERARIIGQLEGVILALEVEASIQSQESEQ